MSTGRVLALDPGIRGSGVALFLGNELQAAAYVRNPFRRGCLADECRAMAHAVSVWSHARMFARESIADRLVVEWPRVRTAGKMIGDANDLLALGAIGTGLASHFSAVPVISYYPDQWKGQLDKAVMNRRVEGRLSAIELGRIERIGALDHNTLDAIGIGLHLLGRLAPVRVFTS